MPDYDESDFQRCLQKVSREVDQYKLNIQVITAVWDFINNTNHLSSSISGIEDSIWLSEEERKVEPDFIALEEGEDFVLGEFKGRVSQFEVDSCVDDIEKYTKSFYISHEALKLEDASPTTPKATFFITHVDHVDRVLEAYDNRYENYSINEVPISFLSYVRYEGTGGQDRMRICFESGESGDSNILSAIEAQGITEPETNTEYEIKTLLMRAYTDDFYFSDAHPPKPYTVVEMVKHLNQYRDPTDPASWEDSVTNVSLQQVIDTFKENYSSEYMSPKSSWITEALTVLDKYDWIHLDDDTLTIYWEEFTKDRRTDDMYKFFAKEDCRKHAMRIYQEEDEEDEDEAQRHLSDFDSDES